MPKIELSVFQRHKARWRGCTRCELHKRRTNVVLLRGSVPCDVLVIGEAPGEGEDTLGKPFVGPAGKLLDQMIEQASYGLHTGGRPFRFAWTNLVACIPLGEDGEKTSEPSKECILACRPRLVEAVRMLKPRMIVLAGELAKKHVTGQSMFADTSRDKQNTEVDWLPPGQEFLEFCEINHPAFILRADFSARGLLMERNVSRLGTALAELAD